jgi:hypothetical protein
LTPLFVAIFRAIAWFRDATETIGPVVRTGAVGPLQSVNFREPDANLIEVSVYERLVSDLTKEVQTGR